MTNRVAEEINHIVQKGLEHYKQDLAKGRLPEIDYNWETAVDYYYIEVYALLEAYGLTPDPNFIYNLEGIKEGEQVRLYYNKSVSTAKVYH